MSIIIKFKLNDLVFVAVVFSATQIPPPIVLASHDLNMTENSEGGGSSFNIDLE